LAVYPRSVMLTAFYIFMKSSSERFKIGASALPTSIIFQERPEGQR